MGLFSWRATLGLKLGFDVVSGVLLFALIMAWRRKIKKVKAVSVLLDFLLLLNCISRGFCQACCLYPPPLFWCSDLLTESSPVGNMARVHGAGRQMWQTAVLEGEDTEMIPTASWESSPGAEQGREVVTE